MSDVFHDHTLIFLIDIIFVLLSKIETLVDLMDMQDEKPVELLQLTTSKLGNIARFCNRYPNIEVSDEISDQDDITFANTVNVHVTLECLDQLSTSVIAPLFQQKRKEGCASQFSYCGTKNKFFNINQTFNTTTKKGQVILDCTGPSSRTQNYILYFMSTMFISSFD